MSNNEKGPRDHVEPDRVPIGERIHAFDERAQDYYRSNGSAHGAAQLAKSGPKILRHNDAFKTIKRQNWLVYNFIERGYVYALTAPSGAGKTAVASLLAYHLTVPRLGEFAGKKVKPGRVIMMLGENPDDALRRDYALTIDYGIDFGRDEPDISFIKGVAAIAEHLPAIVADCSLRGEVALIVVDTASAFAASSGVKDENAAPDMTGYAEMLRSLTTVPGNPAVLVLCHPTKSLPSEREGMQPRGSGGFIAAIDGNMILWPGEADHHVILTHTSKLRGPGFEDVLIHLERKDYVELADDQGVPGRSVVAHVVGSHEADAAARRTTSAEDTILRTLLKGPMRNSEIELATGLQSGTVSKRTRELQKAGLLARERGDNGPWSLTLKGDKVAKKLEGT